jgi:hypothetical protein
MYMCGPAFFRPANLQAELGPTSLVFTQQASINPFDLQPSNLVFLSEPFTSDTGQFNRYTEATIGSTSVSGGQMTVTHAGSQNTIITEGADLTMPQAFVSINVDQAGNAASAYDNFGVGLVKDANNFLFASIDRLASIIRVQSKIAGSNGFFASSTKGFPTSFKLGLSLVANSIGVWLDTGTGWVLQVTYDHTARYDFRTVGNLTGWKAGFTVATGSSSAWKVSSFKAGRFGAVGMRDMTVATNLDGSPYITGNLATFLATAPDQSGTGYCGVFTLNLDTYAITQVGAIMVQRDGKIYNDLAASCVVNSDGSQRLLISTWGNGFGGALKVLYGALGSGNVLSGSNVVSTLSQLTLPLGASGVGAYDPFLAYDSANSRWLLAYTITNNTSFSGNPFYAALAYSSDLSSWTLIGADSAAIGYEGTKLLRVNGAFYNMAGGPAGSGNSSRIYSASMTYLGALNATFSGGTVTQPHPMVFPYGDKQVLLTFDSTPYGIASFTWGRAIVHTANRYTS